MNDQEEVKLTAKQLYCLQAAESASDVRQPELRGISPWSFGSTTIAVLKVRGFLELSRDPYNRAARYLITNAGRKYIQEKVRS